MFNEIPNPENKLTTTPVMIAPDWSKEFELICDASDYVVGAVSYPNFVWGPFFVGMRPSFDHLKMFNIHRCGIRKVPRCFGKKPVKNTKMRVYLAKWGVCK